MTVVTSAWIFGYLQNWVPDEKLLTLMDLLFETENSGNDKENQVCTRIPFQSTSCHCSCCSWTKVGKACEHPDQSLFNTHEEDYDCIQHGIAKIRQQFFHYYLAFQHAAKHNKRQDLVRCQLRLVLSTAISRIN